MNDSKQCSYCGEIKPENLFKQKWSRQCSKCYAAYKRDYNKTQKSKEYYKSISNERYSKHREKYLARSKVSKAIKSGELVRPDNCEDCGIEEKLQAHHNDYSKPLEVLFLCDPCHKHIHGKLKDLSLLEANK